MEAVTRVNETYFVHESYDGDLTTVEVVHIPTGTVGTGHAKRNSEDIYNKKLGRQIAYFRAFERLSRKLVKGFTTGTVDSIYG